MDLTLPERANVNFGLAGCACSAPHHEASLISVTGGPGAGKTAVLKIARQVFCRHVVVMPEAATVVFAGGFWRLDSVAGRKGAQRAIFAVQRQLEAILIDEKLAAVGLCDRGTVDGLAYWPNSPESYWRELGTTHDAELARYKAVVHLRTPKPHNGYNNHTNPVRIETAQQAAALDEAIYRAWDGHPQRLVIDAEDRFESKIAKALEAVRANLPRCCGA